MTIDIFNSHEIDFCTDAGKVIAVINGYMVPSVNSIIQIKKVDYRVINVWWAVDDIRGGPKTLRAVVELVEANVTEIPDA